MSKQEEMYVLVNEYIVIAVVSAKAFEDIVYILNYYITDFKEEILKSDLGVKKYLAEEFKKN